MRRGLVVGAMLLGAAKYLAETRNFDGTAVLIFQPAEEGGGGGNEMLKDGLMERFGVHEVYGMHNMPGIPVGQFAIRPGPMMAAADRFTITIEGKGGHAARPHECIDTLLVDPLSRLPRGSFGGSGTELPIELNLAFRNLVRANMVELASGQEMAEFLGIGALKPEEILTGSEGAVLDGLTDEEKTAFAARTPLWFYILREAELHGGRLTGVGGRLVAEVFHRSMEGSRISIVRDPAWRPSLGPDENTFRMVDLLLVAFDGRTELLAPLGD